MLAAKRKPKENMGQVLYVSGNTETKGIEMDDEFSAFSAFCLILFCFVSLVRLNFKPEANSKICGSESVATAENEWAL